MKIDIKHTTGFVLAGGNSRRMGRDKGLILMDGEPMIQHSIQALKPLCKNIIILANTDNYSNIGYPVYKDHVKDSGPLAGICTGLSISKTDHNIFVSCDSPFVTTELISLLLKHSNNFDAVVPSYENKLFPLTAIYKRSCLNIFENRLKRRLLKVKEATKFVNTNIIELTSAIPFIDKKILTNINTPEELENNNSQF